MFKISRRLDYGLQLMVALARETDGRPQPSARLSEKLNIPLPFLHQIAHTLMQSGLIKASPGPHGGLRLNQAASEISVLKIAETLEGPIVLSPCLDCEDKACVRGENCVLQPMWIDLQKNVIRYLSGISLGMLIHGPNGSPLPGFSLQKTEHQSAPQSIAAD